MVCYLGGLLAASDSLLSALCLGRKLKCENSVTFNIIHFILINNTNTVERIFLLIYNYMLVFVGLKSPKLFFDVCGCNVTKRG